MIRNSGRAALHALPMSVVLIVFGYLILGILLGVSCDFLYGFIQWT